MARHVFPRKVHGEIELDLCFACQGIWFDEHESLQLAPAGVIALFKLLHAHRDDLRQPMATLMHCPRCNEGLIASQDRVKSGLFNYLRCVQPHGRFITFAQFMIEKGFVRQLNGTEIKQLSAQIGTVRCNGCGAPVDIRHQSACTHCRAPITILDPAAVESALANFQQAAQGRPQTQQRPELVGDTLLHAERIRSQQAAQQRNLLTTDLDALLIAGIDMVWDKLRSRLTN
jgi:hypothetical protein